MPLCWRSGFHVGNPVLELLPEYILHARKQIRNNVSLCCSLPSMCCSWHVKQARKGHQIACSVLMTLLGTLAANPKFWAPISNPLHSWDLKKCWHLWSFEALVYNWGCQAAFKVCQSPDPEKDQQSLACHHAEGLMRGWGGSTFLLSPKLKTPGPCLEEAGCFGVIASGLFFSFFTL